MSLFDISDGTPVVRFVNVQTCAIICRELNNNTEVQADSHLFCRAMVTLGGAELTSLCRPMEEI